MDKIVYIIVAFLLVISCMPKDNPKVTITNNSEIFFDSIKVFSSIRNQTVFYKIGKHQKVKGRILFDEKNKGDGAYQVLIYEKDSLYINRSFGYYTNGASLNYRFDILIEKDTLIIDEK